MVLSCLDLPVINKNFTQNDFPIDMTFICSHQHWTLILSSLHQNFNTTEEDCFQAFTFLDRIENTSLFQLSVKYQELVLDTCFSWQLAFLSFIHSMTSWRKSLIFLALFIFEDLTHIRAKIKKKTTDEKFNKRPKFTKQNKIYGTELNWRSEVRGKATSR